MQALRRLSGLLFAHKISRDLAWTFGSFAVLAVSGIAINIIIAATRDAASLGIFNIAYAVYLIGSQIASLGIHYSVLRHAAYYQEQPKERGTMLMSAIILSLCFGCLTGVALYALAPLTAKLFGSTHVAESIRYAALGLLLFPLNKTLIAYVNGLRHMKAFSVLQSLRYITVLIVVSYIAMSPIDFTRATLSFFAAELLTSVCCLAYLARAGLLTKLHLSAEWLKKHVVFGSKGVMAGIFLDLNTRLDVLLLGTLLDERSVGIYSFAAMLIDGVQHILAIVRVNFNPMLVKFLRDKDHRQAKRMLSLSRRYVLLGTFLLCLALIGGFLLVVHLIIPGKGLEEGLICLLILTAGFTLIAGYAPFDNLLLVAGHPGYQTLQCAFVTLVNIALCFKLIPSMGIAGAAIATVTGYVGGMILLLLLAPRLTGWNLLTNRFGRS